MTKTAEELLSNLVDQARSLETGDLASADRLTQRVHMVLRNLYADTKKPWDANASNIRFELSGFLVDEGGGAHRVFDQAKVRLVNSLEAALEERVLATVVFTDIVGSTERVAAIGDARWKELLAEHEVPFL